MSIPSMANIKNVVTVLTNEQLNHIEGAVEIIRSDLFSLQNDEILNEAAAKRVDQLFRDADALFRQLNALIQVS